MSKYTAEFKLEVVQYYLTRRNGYINAAHHFNMSDYTSIQKWVKKI